MIDAVFDYVGVYKGRQTHGRNSKVKIYILRREREREPWKQVLITRTHIFVSLRFYEEWGTRANCRETAQVEKPSIHL